MDTQNEIAQYNLAKLKQISKREPSTPDLEAFADQFFMPKEDLDGRIPQELTWRRPSLSPQEFAFA
jgi:hypothetical protein